MQSSTAVLRFNFCAKLKIFRYKIGTSCASIAPPSQSPKPLVEMFPKIVHKMNTTKLDQFEIENIEDVLPMFEETFKIKLENEETEKLNNFNEFSDLIISKMKFENDNLCTSQRAFYQFRKALESENIIDKSQINPNTDLKSILSKKNRRKNLNLVEKNLGYKIEVLAPSQITINILFYTFVISFIGLFFIWEIAIFGILISVLGFYLTRYTIDLTNKLFEN